MSLSDESWIKTSDAGYFITLMMSQAVTTRPDNISNFATQFYRRLGTCQHVLGQNFATLKASRYNRRAFVHCCRDAFSGFAQDTMMSTFDHAILVRALCPNIATALLHEIHFLITPLGKEQTRTYNVRDLNFGLFFILLYDDWLTSMKPDFGMDSNPKYLKINEAERVMQRIMTDHEIHFDMPTNGALKHIFADLKMAFGEDSEISFDTFRRGCVACKYLRDEMFLLLPAVESKDSM